MPNVSFLDVKTYSLWSAPEPAPLLVILGAQNPSHPSHTKAIGCGWDPRVGLLFCCGLLVSIWLADRLVSALLLSWYLGYLNIHPRNLFCLGSVWFDLVLEIGSNYATLAIFLPGPPGCRGSKYAPPTQFTLLLTSCCYLTGPPRVKQNWTVLGTQASNGFAQLCVLTSVRDLCSFCNQDTASPC